MAQRTRVLLMVGAGVFMSTLDSSMLNVALPTIMQAFSAPLALTEWVVIIYLLTITVSLLFWGRLSRQYGEERIYNLGALIFSIGSLLCFLAPTISLLIFFRFVQAMGAAMMMALGPALIKAIFPQKQLGRSLGQIGIATSLGLMTGPVISGLLIHQSNWRIIFLITVPVGLLVFAVGRKTMSPARSGERNTTDPFDRTGALLWIFAVTMTMVMTTHAAALCRTFSGTILFFAGGSITLAAWYMLIRHEQGHPFPLLPLDLLKERFFSMAMLSAMLSFCVLFCVLLLTPFYLRSILRLSADRIGYVMMALPLCVFFVSPVAGALHDRIGAQVVATTGLFICLTGLILFTTLNTASSPVYVALLLAVLGFGQAMFLSPNSAAAMAGVSHQQSGVTSSLLATARNMGMLVGTALAGLIFSIYFSRLTGGMDMKDFKPVYTPEFLTALKRSFQAAALLAAVGAAASWRRGKSI